MTTIPSELTGIIKCYELGLHFGEHESCGFARCWFLQRGTDTPVAYSETLEGLVKRAIAANYVPWKVLRHMCTDGSYGDITVPYGDGQ